MRIRCKDIDYISHNEKVMMMMISDGQNTLKKVF